MRTNPQYYNYFMQHVINVQEIAAMLSEKPLKSEQPPQKTRINPAFSHNFAEISKEKTRNPAFPTTNSKETANFKEISAYSSIKAQQSAILQAELDKSSEKTMNFSDLPEFQPITSTKVKLFDFDKAFLRPPSELLALMSQYIDKLMGFFALFQEKSPLPPCKLVMIGSFLTNSARKNKLQADFLCIYEEKRKKNSVLQQFSQFLSKENQQIFAAETKFNYNDQEFLKVFLRESQEKAEFGFNFYEKSWKSEESELIPAVLRLNQDFIRVQNHEELAILRRILKNWGWNSCFLWIFMYFLYFMSNFM